MDERSSENRTGFGMVNLVDSMRSIRLQHEMSDGCAGLRGSSCSSSVLVSVMMLLLLLLLALWQQLQLLLLLLLRCCC